MNTIKNLIFAYRWQLLLMCVASQILGIFNLWYMASEGTPAVNNSDTFAFYDMFILYFLIATIMNVIAKELRSQPIYLLPASLLRKYATGLAIVIIFIISCLLFSLVVESIGSVLTAGSPEEAKFALGGYIRYVFESTDGFSILAFVLALMMLVVILVKNKDYNMAINSVICGVAIAGRASHFSPVSSAVVWCFAIIIFIVSYHRYKRWQPANSRF